MDDRLSPDLFSQISRFIEDNFGIRVPLEKKILVQSRLSRRVRELRYPSIDDYIRGILNSDLSDSEVGRMIDLISTHMTAFFREQKHFDILKDQILPQLCSQQRFTEIRPLLVWSAACSTGEEAYTLAMVLDRFRKESRGRYGVFEYAVLATDLSEGALAVARKAVYPASSADPIPRDYQKDYLMHSRSGARPRIKVVPELRQRVFFHPMNLLATDYDIHNAIHVIFCRNVLIYFDRRHQEAVLHHLNSDLQPGGFVFVGHAESMSGVVAGLETYAPTIYWKNPNPTREV